MRRQVTVALCSAALCAMASSSLSIAQQRTAHACLAEPQANKAANEYNRVTARADVGDCFADGTPGQSAGAMATLVARSGNAARDRPIYSSIKDLMESVIDPSADVLWGAVGTVIDKEGNHEMLPKTQEEWLDVRRAAVRIIEGGNLLMMAGREAAPAGTKSEASGIELEPDQITVLVRKNRKSFNGFARALQGLGLEALRASDTKNVDLLLEVGGRMENVCEGCHQTFWYPPEKHALNSRMVSGLLSWNVRKN